VQNTPKLKVLRKIRLFFHVANTYIFNKNKGLLIRALKTTENNSRNIIKYNTSI
jgi:hypothetical protein